MSFPIPSQQLTSELSYISTVALAERLREIDATGVEFDQVEITTDGELAERLVEYPEFEIPPLEWVKVTGTAGVDDFGRDSRNYYSAVISERVVEEMRKLGLKRARLHPYTPSPETLMKE